MVETGVLQRKKMDFPAAYTFLESKRIWTDVALSFLFICHGEPCG